MDREIGEVHEWSSGFLNEGSSVELDSTMAIKESWVVARCCGLRFGSTWFIACYEGIGWKDFSNGRNHRCVHCLIGVWFANVIGGRQPAQIKRCAILKHWKSNQVKCSLQQSSKWRLWRTMEYRQWMPQQPQPFEFANVLEQLFAGHWLNLVCRKHLGLWLRSKKQLRDWKQTQLLMMQGLLLDFCTIRQMFCWGHCYTCCGRCCWLEKCRKRGNKLCSTCCPKPGEQNQHPTFVNCCGQAVIPNFCIFGAGSNRGNFGRGTSQRKQHGFRTDRCIEEHLPTTNSHLVKTLTFDVPMWHTCRNIAGYVGC